MSEDFTELTRKKRIKFSWLVIVSVVVGAIVGSGIVRHSVKWVAAGGMFAILGLLIVWVAYFVIGLLMCDNTAMMPERGGVYAWTRKTMGRFWGTQVGWIYLVGFMCLSVILAWIAYVYTLNAIIYFIPEQSAKLGAVIFSVIIPMVFIIVFSLIFTSGVKGTTQVIVGFFCVKVTMWLTIVGISLLRYDAGVAINIPDIDPLWSSLSVAILCLFAMNGIDAVSVIADDIHEPKKNYLKGTIIGMLIVILLYASTVILIMGLIGQQGAQDIVANNEGLVEIFLSRLSVPPPVLLIFIVISVIGTLFINMYMVVRTSGAMALNKDFFFSNHATKNVEELKDFTGIQRPEMPVRSIMISNIIYMAFFALIFIQDTFYPGANFMLYIIDNLALFPFLVVLFFIALTNFKAHRMKIWGDDKEKHGFAFSKGYVLSIFGMVAIVFIMGLQVYMTWTDVSYQPGITAEVAPTQWQFWNYLGMIFPVFMVVPGLLYWIFRGRSKTIPVGGRPNKEEKQSKKDTKKQSIEDEKQKAEEQENV